MSCLVCNKPLELLEAFTCGLGDCEMTARTINIGDEYVSNYLKSQPDVVYFLLNLATIALMAAKAATDYQPMPIFLGETVESSFQLLKAQLKAISKIWTTLSRLVDGVVTTNSDEIIEKECGLVIYGWIRFTLKSSLLKLGIDPTLKIPGLKIIRVEHFLEDTQIKRSESLTNQGLFFHGSTNLNWYSIINRGLKNYSGTTKGVHGAAYGNGIYLAANSLVSIGYCVGLDSVLGVFEILDDATKYQKSIQNKNANKNGNRDGSIYVVPDETKVRIRYLITGSYFELSAKLSAIDEIFSTTVVTEKKCQKQITSHIKNKRLLHEIKYFSQTDLTHYGIRCQFNDQNMTMWSIFLSGFESKSDLAQDLIKIARSEIEMEIRFPEEFPLKPPFVRIVRPRFEFRTGHITLGGSICLELLTNQGWNPTYSIENLIIHIKSVILGGEGRIDMKRWADPYSYSEALEAFQRMILSHGW